MTYQRFKLGWFDISTLVSITLLCACNSDNDVKSNTRKIPDLTHLRFRAESEACASTEGYRLNGKISPESYSQWHVRMDKEGVIYWNGSQINVETLQQYLSSIRKINANSEFISAEIEPGALCTDVERLRKEIVKSRLCLEGRCTENVWSITTPLVN